MGGEVPREEGGGRGESPRKARGWGGEKAFASKRSAASKCDPTHAPPARRALVSRGVGGLLASLPRYARLRLLRCATPADYSGLRPLGFFGGLAPQTPLNGSICTAAPLHGSSPTAQQLARPIVPIYLPQRLLTIQLHIPMNRTRDQTKRLSAKTSAASADAHQDHANAETTPPTPEAIAKETAPHQPAPATSPNESPKTPRRQKPAPPNQKRAHNSRARSLVRKKIHQRRPRQRRHRANNLRSRPSANIHAKSRQNRDQRRDRCRDRFFVRTHQKPPHFIMRPQCESASHEKMGSLKRRGINFSLKGGSRGACPP